MCSFCYDFLAAWIPSRYCKTCFVQRSVSQRKKESKPIIDFPFSISRICMTAKSSMLRRCQLKVVIHQNEDLILSPSINEFNLKCPRKKKESQRVHTNAVEAREREKSEKKPRVIINTEVTDRSINNEEMAIA